MPVPTVSATATTMPAIAPGVMNGTVLLSLMPAPGNLTQLKPAGFHLWHTLPASLLPPCKGPLLRPSVLSIVMLAIVHEAQ